MRRIDPSVYNDIADESSINAGHGFMDGYYASNGYFSFSQTAEEMRSKDTLFDKLQTFVDERLLEIAAQIGVKQTCEEQKQANIEKLCDIKDNIDKLITESKAFHNFSLLNLISFVDESIQELKSNEYRRNRNLLNETDHLQQLLNDVKKKQEQRKLNHYLEMEDINKTFEFASASYNETEQDYLNSKKAIRMEMHEDKTLIKNLETSLIEADLILGNLGDKAKFSKKLESERRKMIKDRSLLLKDL